MTAETECKSFSADAVLRPYDGRVPPHPPGLAMVPTFEIAPNRWPLPSLLGHRTFKPPGSLETGTYQVDCVVGVLLTKNPSRLYLVASGAVDGGAGPTEKELLALEPAGSELRWFGDCPVRFRYSHAHYTRLRVGMGHTFYTERVWSVIGAPDQEGSWLDNRLLARRYPGVISLTGPLKFAAYLAL